MLARGLEYVPVKVWLVEKILVMGNVTEPVLKLSR